MKWKKKETGGETFEKKMTVTFTDLMKDINSQVYQAE